MASYVILLNWTDQGARESRNTVERAKAFATAVEGLGGKVREHLYTLGEYDIVMVAEFPSDDAAASALIGVASLGNVRTKTRRAFTDEEAAAFIARLS